MPCSTLAAGERRCREGADSVQLRATASVRLHSSRILHPALVTVIRDRLLEQGARLADGSRPKTSADGVSWRS